MPTRSRETKDIILVTPQDPEMGSPHYPPPFICGKSLRGPGIKPYIQEEDDKRGQPNQQRNIEPASFLSNFTPLFLSSPESLVHIRYCYLPKECYKHDPVSHLALFICFFLVVLVLGSKMCPAYFRNKGGLRGNTSEAIRKCTKGPWPTPPSP